MRTLFQHTPGGSSNVNFIAENGRQPFGDTLLELLAGTIFPEVTLPLIGNIFM